MLALVSSTITPPASECYDGARSRFSPAERLEQTRASVGSLAALGFRRIVIADNGVPLDDSARLALLPATVLHFPTTQFRNKGLSELFLLRDAAATLPADAPILKLSGRYLLTRNPLDELGSADLVARSDAYSSKRGAISSRAYACRDVATFRRLIARTLDEAFAYPHRIVGPRSLWTRLCAHLAPGRDTFPYADPPHSIEFLLARAAKLLRLRVGIIPQLGVRGTMAGTGEVIDE